MINCYFMLLEDPTKNFQLLTLISFLIQKSFKCSFLVFNVQNLGFFFVKVLISSDPLLCQLRIEPL